VAIPDGEKIVKICLFVLTECTKVTDRRTDRQTDGRTDNAWRHRPRLHSIAPQKFNKSCHCGPFRQLWVARICK